MDKENNLVQLENIGHWVQSGFLAVVTILQQIRDGQRGSPSPQMIESSAALLRRVSAILYDEKLE
jgi:hypothetical protein